MASEQHKRAAVLAALTQAGLPEPLQFYSTAGTPLAAALLTGRISVLVEPHPVSLHDAALLLPHQILGGEAFSATTGRPFSPLDVYERNADDLRPEAKPFTEGYLVWGGYPQQVDTVL